MRSFISFGMKILPSNNIMKYLNTIDNFYKSKDITININHSDKKNKKNFSNHLNNFEFEKNCCRYLFFS